MQGEWNFPPTPPPHKTDLHFCFTSISSEAMNSLQSQLSNVRDGLEIMNLFKLKSGQD